MKSPWLFVVGLQCIQLFSVMAYPVNVIYIPGGVLRQRRWIPDRFSNEEFGVDTNGYSQNTYDGGNNALSHTNKNYLSYFWPEYFSNGDNSAGDYTGMLYRASNDNPSHVAMDPVQQLQNVQTYSYAQMLRPYGYFGRTQEELLDVQPQQAPVEQVSDIGARSVLDLNLLSTNTEEEVSRPVSKVIFIEQPASVVEKKQIFFVTPNKEGLKLQNSQPLTVLQPQQESQQPVEVVASTDILNQETKGLTVAQRIQQLGLSSGSKQRGLNLKLKKTEQSSPLINAHLVANEEKLLGNPLLNSDLVATEEKLLGSSLLTNSHLVDQEEKILEKPLVNLHIHANKQVASEKVEAEHQASNTAEEIRFNEEEEKEALQELRREVAILNEEVLLEKEKNELVMERQLLKQEQMKLSESVNQPNEEVEPMKADDVEEKQSIIAEADQVSTVEEKIVVESEQVSTVEETKDVESEDNIKEEKTDTAAEAEELEARSYQIPMSGPYQANNPLPTTLLNLVYAAPMPPMTPLPIRSGPPPQYNYQPRPQYTIPSSYGYPSGTYNTPVPTYGFRPSSPPRPYRPPYQSAVPVPTAQYGYGYETPTANPTGYMTLPQDLVMSPTVVPDNSGYRPQYQPAVQMPTQQLGYGYEAPQVAPNGYVPLPEDFVMSPTVVSDNSGYYVPRGARQITHNQRIAQPIIHIG